MSKTVAVTGATGAQGGSVARILLESGKWHVRAITRNASSDAAKALVAAGAEIVVADMNDEESLISAFKNSHAVFAVTNFWEHLFSGNSPDESGKKEQVQALNLARAAAKTTTLEHYIWSTLAPAAEMTGGKFPCPHLDYKARVDDIIRSDMPELAAKTTFLLAGWYPSNMAYFPMVKPVQLPMGGKYIWPQPIAPSGMLPVLGDIRINPGVWVRQILAHPQKTQGKYMTIVTETMSVEDILKVWSEVTGKEAICLHVSDSEYNNMWPGPGAELTAQFKFNEAVPDWESFRKADFVKAEEIGISDSEAVGLKGALESIKASLL